MSWLSWAGIIGVIASAVVAGAFGLIRLAVRDVTSAAEQRGRDEIIKQVQREDAEAARRAGNILAEHRTVDGTADKLSDGRF